MAGAADPKDDKAPVATTPVPDTSGSPPEGYSPEEWTSLSETEREGIKDSIDNPEGDGPTVDELAEGKPEGELDEKALAAIAAEGDKKPPEKPVTDGAEVKPPAAVTAASEVAAPASKAEGGASPAKPPEPAATVEEAELPTDEDLLTFRPPESALVVKLPNVVPAEIQTKLDALDSKYDAGDIEMKEYNRERDALNREVTEAQLQARDAARAQKTWDIEQATFLRARPEYLEKDAEGKFTERSELLFGAFGNAVKRISADPKYTNASGMTLLIAADKAVRGAFGISAPGKKKASGNPPPAAPPTDGGKPPTPKPDLKTLAAVPSAAPNSTDDGFAAIDKLTGAAFEAALERMSQEQRDSYAARA